MPTKETKTRIMRPINLRQDFENLAGELEACDEGELHDLTRALHAAKLDLPQIQSQASFIVTYLDQIVRHHAIQSGIELDAFLPPPAFLPPKREHAHKHSDSREEAPK